VLRLLERLLWCGVHDGDLQSVCRRLSLPLTESEALARPCRTRARACRAIKSGTVHRASRSARSPSMAQILA
jgi:hypothetical protein